VTGTLVSGTIRREDELEVFPTGRRVRVRGVQVHGQIADAALAGQRTALNLAGASTEDLSRGMTLVPPGTFETTRRMDVLLRLLPSAPRALKSRARVHLHSFTMETVAEVVLHERKELDPAFTTNAKVGHSQLLPGEEAFARLKLPEAALLLPGDRFIIRQFSPVVTIGGGVVLDAAPIPRVPSHLEFLKITAGDDATAILRARIARRHHEGISMPRLVAETGWSRSVIESQSAQLVKMGEVVRAGDLLLHLPAVEALKSQIGELRRQMATYKVKSATIDIVTFKELTGVTRKYAIPLLEYLDREHVTKRVGDAREIL